jgi:hypothetical protein
MKNPKRPLSFRVTFYPSCGAYSGPCLMILLPKKEGGKNWVYFRFLSAQNATIPMMQATATATSIATSVVMNGVSAVGSVGSGVVGSGVVGFSSAPGAAGSGSVGAGAAGCSGSIVAAGAGASVTPIAVSANDGP